MDAHGGVSNFPQLVASPLFPLLLLTLTTQKNSPKTTDKFKNKYDYIIVGAGSAGSVVASRLSEVSCVSVLLLEAGGPAPLVTDIPALNNHFYPHEIDWNYMTVPHERTGSALINRQSFYSRGKVLGGSSTVNGMVYTRGNRHNYNDWASMGAEGWSYDEVLPYFLKLEDNVNFLYLLNGFHNTGGPITVSLPSYFPRVKGALIKSALSLGYKFVDSNGPTQYGFYYPQATIRDGQKCGTAKAYLVPAEDRPNLDILPNALVTKILIEDNRAVGVQFELNGTVHQVSARKEVIVSGGSFNTPQILMLSGVGPKSVLDNLQIPVIADLPVGDNYQDRIAGYVFYEFGDSLTNWTTRLSEESNVRKYINKRQGILAASPAFHVLAFLSENKTDELEDRPEYELQFFELNTETIGNLGLTPEALQAVFGPHMNEPVFVCYAILVNPKSRGTVRIRSSDPKDPPEIDPNFFEDPQDFEHVVDGMKACHRVLSSPSMIKSGARVFNTTFPGCKTLSEDFEESLRCSVRSFITPYLHASGTAKMGNPDDPTTVVDSKLRVKSIQGLRVADASIIPKSIWGHTNVPAIMIGEKASDIIKETITCE